MKSNSSKGLVAHVCKGGEYYKAFIRKGKIEVYVYEEQHHRESISFDMLSLSVQEEIAKKLNIKIVNRNEP